MKYTDDSGEGVVVAGGNGPGEALDQLNKPAAVQGMPDGSIFVVDSGNDRVLKFVDSATGEVVAGGAGHDGLGFDVNQLSQPMDLQVLADGFLYVSDHLNNRVVMYPPDGCSAPSVANAPTPPCEEGIFIQSGAFCTPRCRQTFKPTKAQVQCTENGALLEFACTKKKPPPAYEKTTFAAAREERAAVVAEMPGYRARDVAPTSVDREREEVVKEKPPKTFSPPPGAPATGPVLEEEDQLSFFLAGLFGGLVVGAVALSLIICCRVLERAAKVELEQQATPRAARQYGYHERSLEPAFYRPRVGLSPIIESPSPTSMPPGYLPNQVPEP
jgi:hypothetical protein